MMDIENRRKLYPSEERVKQIIAERFKGRKPVNVEAYFCPNDPEDYPLEKYE